MYDWNGSIRSLNVGLPDDIARLKAAGYYQELPRTCTTLWNNLE